MNLLRSLLKARIAQANIAKIRTNFEAASPMESLEQNRFIYRHFVNTEGEESL